jgi:hypothetical protein
MCPAKWTRDGSQLPVIAGAETAALTNDSK